MYENENSPHKGMTNENTPRGGTPEVPPTPAPAEELPTKVDPNADGTERDLKNEIKQEATNPVAEELIVESGVIETPNEVSSTITTQSVTGTGSPTITNADPIASTETSNPVASTGVDESHITEGEVYDMHIQKGTTSTESGKGGFADSKPEVSTEARYEPQQPHMLKKKMVANLVKEKSKF